MERVLIVKSEARTQLLDITAPVQELVKQSAVSEGWCVLYCPHTTAAVTINEAADPMVGRDIIEALDVLVPWGHSYHHQEGNADAHIKAVLVGASETVLIKKNELFLGQWQGLYFCEFDGPRQRQLIVSLGENGTGKR